MSCAGEDPAAGELLCGGSEPGAAVASDAVGGVVLCVDAPLCLREDEPVGEGVVFCDAT
jgi:hypothetical protein